MADVRGYVQQAQDQTQWCWAAVAVSTAICFDPHTHWTQCSLAEAELQFVGCCDNGGRCNVQSSLSSALNQTATQRPGSPLRRTLTTAEIQQEIDAERPVPIRVENADGSGHFVVIAGYDDAGGGDLTLRILDPWGPQKITTRHSKLVAGSTGWRWTHSYLTH